MEHKQTSSVDETPTAQITSIQRTTIHILSASYGPAEGRRLLDGTLVDYSERESFIPYIRDAIPFLAALASHEYSLDNEESGGPCINIGNKNEIALMDGKSMNAVFGDPCSGTTKLLRVEYLFRDYYWSNDAKHSEGRKLACTTSRVYTSTFAEHDRVILKRQDALFRFQAENEEEQLSTSSTEQPEITSQASNHPENTPDLSTNSTSISPSLHVQSSKQSLSYTAQNTSEITLRLILPYLTVRERAKCQLICTSWRYIVKDTGIAVTIDVNDTTLFSKDTLPNANTRPNIASMSPSFIPQSPAVSNEEQGNNSHRELLRGLLAHSHSSLESLVLNDFLPLRPLMDLHPTLPHLRKLKRLDISRVATITDETLHLISTFIGPRLEVLYMKGLRHISNAGVVHLAQSCLNLRVLDVSFLHQLDDEAGIAIGSNLKKLEVFHARDNYKWTNKSVDVITSRCEKLVQATFWGCIRLNHICFEDQDPPVDEDFSRSSNKRHRPSLIDVPTSIAQQTPKQIILLNLWGCHGIQNSSAAQLSSLVHLRSLCVSECHKLSDDFVVGVTQSLRHLLHLQLRYLRRITDASLESISSMLPKLYSIDVSFCTKLTMGGITKLLRERSDSLAELRLFSCRQLNPEGGSIGAGMSSGRTLTRALSSVKESSILSLLDLRKCHEHESMIRDATFIQDMADLGFVEELHCFFRRPAVWSERVVEQLSELCDD
ncbi:hypothetical protein ACHAWO_009210 [Cyclotella atomus]|uniref:F-box domain-containing protein n=1 Tax=Cyclotella atomus TaxID=382360 RepID=A0ABD3P2R3_9STRA